MFIDWKVVSKSLGYISLKATMIKDIQETARRVQKNFSSSRDNEEYHKKFRWVISRAIHYAHHEKVTVDVILYRWEKDRTYWWFMEFGNENR